jgi:hypothetical protein
VVVHDGARLRPQHARWPPPSACGGALRVGAAQAGGGQASVLYAYTLHLDGSVSYAKDSHVKVVRPAGGSRRDAYILLKVTYDKNLKRGQARLHPIPYSAMGVRPVDLLGSTFGRFAPPRGATF